jgi:tRNA threonylcarbamoyladenosine biosynthesis protein TsaB
MVHVLLLAADTSSPSGSLAVLRDHTVLASRHAVSDEAYSSRLFRDLQSLLADLSLALNDFDAFAVASGPGSFTGLRVGLAAAKAWAEAYSKPVFGISALHAVAIQSPSACPVLVPVIDARRQQLYYAVFEHSLSFPFFLGDERVASSEGVLDDLRRVRAKSTFALVTYDSEFVARSLPGVEKIATSVNVVSPCLAPWIGHIALDHARSGKSSDSLSLDANYIRRSDAELHWKGP